MNISAEKMFLEGSRFVLVGSKGFPWKPAGRSKYCALSIVSSVKEISGSMVIWAHFYRGPLHAPLVNFTFRFVI